MGGPNTTATDRAKVGIGTLLVFVAMILVGAIAAGILLFVASNLQSEATEVVGNQPVEGIYVIIVGFGL